MLQLEVGKKYRRRDGTVIETLAESGHERYPFYDTRSKVLYTAYGRYYTSGSEHPFDLIEEVADEAVTIEPGEEFTIADDDSYQHVPLETSHVVQIAPKTDALPDSGDRTNFSTGAVRDAMQGKGLPSLIPPQAIIRLARRFEDGAEKYSRNNWMKGIPLSRFQDAIQRHLLAAAEGKTDEDHLGAVLWNAAAWIWTEDEIAAGRLPAELDDLPYRSGKAVAE